MRAFRILILVSAVLPLMASGATLRLSVRAPATNVANDSCGFAWTDSGVVVVPGTPLLDLKEILVMGRRFVDPADSVLGAIPALGLEGDSIPFDLEIRDGSMGSVWVLARDTSGNVSCKGAEYVFAFPAVEAPPPASGTGLRGEYFTWDMWNDFKVKLGERVDSMVDFAWGADSPWPGGPVDYVSGRLTGWIAIPADGTYTFYVGASDGERLYLNEIPAQTYWTHRRDAETASTHVLVAGQLAIRLEFYTSWGSTARLSLAWSGPGFSKRIVPTWVLAP